MADGDHPLQGVERQAREEEDPLSEDLRQRMQTEFKKLPRLTQQIFLAHRIDELSYAEIAARTGVSTRRVEQEMVRALLCIDRALSGPRRRTKWWRWPSSGPSHDR